MNSFTPLVALLTLSSGALLGSGCATVTKGTTQSIPVTSQPAGARVIVDGAEAGRTPTTLKLSRKQNHVITFAAEGYEQENLMVTKAMGAAVAGNIFNPLFCGFGALAGWGVDAISGAQYNLYPETVNVRLREVRSATAVTAVSPTTVFVEELNKLDDLVGQKKVTPEEYARMRIALVESYQKAIGTTADAKSTPGQRDDGGKPQLTSAAL